MIIQLFYFTSTGNTEYLVKEAQKYLSEIGNTVSVGEINKHVKFLEEAELTGIFYPVWSSDLPFPVKEFLTDNEFSNKNIFLIGDCAVFSGDTGRNFKRELEEKTDNKVVFADSIKMPSNVNIPGFERFSVNEEKKKEIVKNSKEKLRQMLDKILAGEIYIEGSNPIKSLGGKMQRKISKTSFSGFTSQLDVDYEKCKECHNCYKICPEGNIHINDDNSIFFGDECIFCLSCYNLCPEDAINFGEKTKDTKKYKRYKGPDGNFKHSFYR